MSDFADGGARTGAEISQLGEGREGWGPTIFSRAATACHDINAKTATSKTGSGAPREGCSRTDVLSVLESAQKRVFVRPSALLCAPKETYYDVRLPKVNVQRSTISQAPQAPRKLVSDSVPMFSFWVR